MNIPDSDLKKLQKLFNMANRGAESDSEAIRNEAQAAMKRAHALLSKHGLSAADVEATMDDGEEKVKINFDDLDEQEVGGFSSGDRWTKHVISAVAIAFGCRSWYYARARRCFLYGLPGDIAVARAMIDPMKQALSKGTRRYLKEIREEFPEHDFKASGIEARSYKDGFVRGLHETAEELAQQAAQDKSLTTTANALVVMTDSLVAARDDALEQYKKDKGVKPSRPTSVERCAQSYGAGHLAGRSQILNRGGIQA